MSTPFRAALYARYSSENQRDASIDDQVRLCQALVAREGWGVTAVYTDRAVSGATALRAGYQRLLEDVRAGGIDVVVAEGLDRLSRDQEDVAGLFKRLGFLGVEIHTVAEGRINELHVGLKGTMNALFLKDLALKTHRGLQGRIEAGRSAGGRCYGYAVVRELDAMGEPVRGKRRIDAAEAAVVRRIFTAYVAGVSPRRIALTLNQEGIPGPDGAAWTQSTINGSAARGTGILNNALYVGRLVWNRQRYLKDPSTGRRVSRPNPPERHLVQEVPDLRIVPQDLWEAAGRRRLKLKRDTRPDLRDRPFWAQRRPRHLLAGKLVCGACGGSFTKISATHLGCTAARAKGTCTNRHTIRVEALERLVLDGLTRHLFEPAAFEAFVAAFHEAVNAERIAASAARAGAEAELRRIAERLRRIVDLIADGTVSHRVFHEEIRALEAREDALRAGLAAPPAVPDGPLLHPNLARVYRQRVERLTDLLADPGHRVEAFDAIRELVSGVRLVPSDAGLAVELEGELAAMLRLGAARTHGDAAAVGGGPGQRNAAGLLCGGVFVGAQCEVVAGARNRLNLLFDAPRLR